MAAFRLVACFLLALSACPLFARVWNDNTGKHSIEADLVRVEGDSVLLKKSDQKVIKVPLTALCKADRDFGARKQPAGTSEPITSWAFVCARRARLAVGRKELFQVCDRDSTHVGALNNLALTQVRQRKYSDALNNWKAALKIRRPPVKSYKISAVSWLWRAERRSCHRHHALRPRVR